VNNSGVMELDGGSSFQETAGTLDNTGTLVLGADDSA
jgi:hypothetical protein